ncbi:hypothetical protein EZY14_017875 [Kordia sp. TARA_039_SRF]|nr:hypothetical protein EZY14_017875 [Kordia sp. TARA_039_SRF]
MEKKENTILSDKYDDFVKDKSSISSQLDTYDELVPDVYKGLKAPVSSWPVIINQNKKEVLKKLCITIPKLLHKIPELYFNNNLKKISEFYFGGDTDKGQFSLLCHNKQEEVSSRLDLIDTEDGFKILEVNMGSSLGGMEFQNFERLMSKLHPILSPDNKKFIHRKSQTIYVEFLINKIEEYVSSSDRELGIFFIDGTPGEYEARNLVKKFFNDLLEKELSKRGKTGMTYMDEVSNLKYINDGLFYKGKRIHAILAIDYSANDLSLDVFRALLANKIYFPDHLGTMFMRDKRNLVLLRKLAIANKFSEEDNETILKYIPWTEIITDDIIQYKGKDYSMPALLADKREDFVIKIADGLQGDDVYVGRFHEQDAWEKIIQEVIKKKIFVVQEFLESINVYAPDIRNEWVNHELVWGSFGFGKNYGGSWIRMVSQEKNLGVINSAKGAVGALVYEALPQKIAPQKRFSITKK